MVCVRTSILGDLDPTPDHSPRAQHTLICEEPVNTGGFVSTIIAVGLIGIVLQLAAPGGNYDLHAYRLAFASLALPWAVGVVGILRNRRRARADWAADGVIVPPIRDSLAQRKVRRSS
jgi:hypothetical protein